MSRADARLRERASRGASPLRNKILLAIPEAEYRLFLSHLEPVSLAQQAILHEPGRKLDFVYFVNRGLVSLLVTTEDGKTVESGMVGSEGMLGISAAVGLSIAPLRQVVQIAGDAYRVKAGFFQTRIAAAPQLQLALSRYAVVQGMQMAQIAACNRLHDVSQRLARWLLMAQDRVESRSLPVTHDFLAALLGTDRPSVSLAAKGLRKKGAIQYSRGAVQILSRKKLEAAGCECYNVIHQFNGILRLSSHSR